MNFPKSWDIRRSRFCVSLRDVRGEEAPLASATKDGVFLRDDLEISVWNPLSNTSNYKLVESDDFVIGLRSFQHGISHSKVRGNVSPAYTVLRPGADVYAGYLKYYFRSSLLISQLANITQGIRQGQAIDIEAFRNLLLPVPPLWEQRRIADFLDAEATRIDRLIELRQRQLVILADRYASSISEITTPGISASRDRNAKWPWLPVSLQTARLGYLARVQSGVTVHEARERSGEDAEFPYLRVANVQGERIDLSEVKSITIPVSMARRSMLQPGDLVMTEANGNPDNLGRGAVWHGELPNMVHQNHVFAIRVNREYLIPEYVSALLAAAHGRRYFRFTATQVGIATTSSSKVLDFPVPVLSLDAQRHVVAECDRVRASVDRAKAALIRQVDLLAERKRALVTAAVTGQFDVASASGRGVGA
ncbi:hypothetical protein FLW53_35095 [Microbispora sp. SCL1-1]|uniref:hypothetical protein n=1 Tax=Microbispora TaxID=2005 RepID=UPI001158E555|nr:MULTISPECIES: hypothetical protein [unclassified Microbispora]NJP29338.1 hypothetical protein [Microbispora sp. CL1-1]TQS05419.1 hypothetical protein FLW53_35095 [Microbispora sp. SCL1-1]